MLNNLNWDPKVVNYIRACAFSNSTGIHDESLYASGTTGVVDIII